MRNRRDEVCRQNEFFERLLADAAPGPFEDRKMFISTCRNSYHQQFYEQQQEATGKDLRRIFILSSLTEFSYY